MKKILVTTDFSPCAANAFEYALCLARQANARVDVLHAIHPTEGMHNNIYDSLFINDYYAQKEKALHDWVQDFKDMPAFEGVDIHASYKVGFLSDAVKEFSADTKVDLVVMGTMGASGIGNILGSNASMVSSKIKNPTLLVPMHKKYVHGAKLALATDFGTKGLASNAQFMNAFLRILGISEMDVVCVMDEKAEKPSSAHEAELISPIEKVACNFRYIHDDEPTRAIENYIEGTDTDILCTVKHHHNFLYRFFMGSRTKELVKDATTTVLVLHD